MAAGSVQAALQAVAARAGYGFTAELTQSPGWRRVAAQVSDGCRSTRVLMAQSKRSFGVDCWVGGIWMAAGETPDLLEVAGVADFWLSAPRVRDLVARFADGHVGETESAPQAIALVVDSLPEDAVPDPPELRPWA